LEANPERKSRVKKGRPLAVSYRRGKPKVHCRYDFIYATPGIAVEKAQCNHIESIEAGSDHAAVVAGLDFRNIVAEKVPLEYPTRFG
jgi:endonuclease/exonuclease/phosphatase family metal-dependent hydrolase